MDMRRRIHLELRNQTRQLFENLSWTIANQMMGKLRA